MKRAVITADGILSIITGILFDEDINKPIEKIEDGDPITFQDELNVEYYTFKYRPDSTEQIIADLKSRGEDTSVLMGLGRSFCCLVLGTIERLFTPDVDQCVIEGVLDFWLQTNKIKTLERLIDNANTQLTGIRIPVDFGGETRDATVIFDAPTIPDFDLESQIGESVRISVGFMVMLNPSHTVYYRDYTVTFNYQDGTTAKTSTVPLTGLNYSSDYIPKPVPFSDKPSNVGSLNLSRSFALVVNFDGLDNEFIDWLTLRTLNVDCELNVPIETVMSRKGVATARSMVIQRHEVRINADTGNENHTLNLAPRGIR